MFSYLAALERLTQSDFLCEAFSYKESCRYIPAVRD